MSSRRRDRSGHRASVRRRKPPWNSYEAVTRASASRASVRQPGHRPHPRAAVLSSSVDRGEVAGESGERPLSAHAAHGAARLRRVADEARPCRRTSRSSSGAAGSRRATGASAGTRARAGRAPGGAARLGSSSSRSRNRVSASKARGFASGSPNRRSIASAPTSPTPSRYRVLARRLVRAEQLDARDGLELTAALMEHDLDVRERLEARAEAGLRLRTPFAIAPLAPGRACTGAGRDRPRRAAASAVRPPPSWSPTGHGPVYKRGRNSLAPGPFRALMQRIQRLHDPVVRLLRAREGAARRASASTTRRSRSTTSRTSARSSTSSPAAGRSPRS